MPELGPATLPNPTERDGSRLTGAAIASVAMAVPDRVVPNAPIAERLGITEEWIVKRTGVRERRLAEPGETLTGLAAGAGAQALARAAADPLDVDLVLVATMSPDDVAPSAAAGVAARLGADRAGAVDVGAACTGFLSALALAGAYIEGRRAENVLVIGADMLSRITNPDDRSTAALLADGAGAALVRRSAGGSRIGPVVLGSDGARGALITADRIGGPVRMNGHDTFIQAVARMGEATHEALRLADRSIADVDLFVYHQANSRIIAALGAELGLPAERVVDYVPRFGNTSAATLPMALALAEEEGRLAPGSLVLLAAFGGGLTWGATTVEWGRTDA
jgi:3-oxoacyl-[acyl-carrier-protein] synthase III